MPGARSLPVYQIPNLPAFQPSNLLHWQVLQDRLHARPVGGVPAYVRPEDLAGPVDDEDRRSGDAIAEQIVDTVSLGHGVVGVGQYGEGSLGHLGHVPSTGQAMYGQSYDLGVTLLEVLVMVAQIHDLLAAGTSGLPPVEDEHYI
jgi:hypothetical protein